MSLSGADAVINKTTDSRIQHDLSY